MREHSIEGENLHFHIIFQMVKLDFTYIFTVQIHVYMYTYTYIKEKKRVELNSRKYE